MMHIAIVMPGNNNRRDIRFTAHGELWDHKLSSTEIIYGQNIPYAIRNK